MTVPSVRVLVIDDDVRVQTDLVEMLDPASYDVRAAQGSGDTLIRNARRSAARFRPHIAIVDLCLWGDSAPDLSGLDVIAELESSHCILYSAYLNVQVTRLARADRVTWVSKAESPQQLLDAVEREVHEIYPAAEVLIHADPYGLPEHRDSF